MRPKTRFKSCLPYSRRDNSEKKNRCNTTQQRLFLDYNQVFLPATHVRDLYICGYDVKMLLLLLMLLAASGAKGWYSVDDPPTNRPTDKSIALSTSTNAIAQIWYMVLQMCICDARFELGRKHIHIQTHSKETNNISSLKKYTASKREHNHQPLYM